MSDRDEVKGSPDWDVESALRELVKAVREGSPLRVPKKTRKALKDGFRSSFEKQHSAKESWEKDKRRVLRLAYLVGLLGCFFECQEAARDMGKPWPKKLGSDAAMKAAVIVKQSGYCPPPGSGIGLKGRWCTFLDTEFGPVDAKSLLAALLAQQPPPDKS